MEVTSAPFARSYCIEKRLGEEILDGPERLVRTQRGRRDLRVGRDMYESEYSDPRQVDLTGHAMCYLEPFA